MNNHEQPSTMIEKFPRRQLWKRCAISKKLISHFDPNVFSIVVWILSQLTVFVLKLRQKSLHEQKSTVWKTALMLQYYLLECCLIYSAVNFFTFFNKSDGGFHGNGISICIFTNTINNSAQLKDREMQLFVLFLLIILKMCSSEALECAAFVCFLRKLFKIA